MLLAIPVSLSLLLGGAELHEHKRAEIQLETDLGVAEREDVFAVAIEARRKAGELLESVGMTRKSDQDLRLRVYSHESDFEDWQRRVQNWKTVTEPLAFYQEDDRVIVAAWKNGASDARAQLRGECARVALLQWAKNPPAWFEEGFVAYFEGFEADEYGDVIDTVHAQHFDDIRRAVNAEHYCPLYELMDLQHVDYFGVAGAKKVEWSRGTLIAQSWSLVYFLLEARDPEVAKLRSMVVARLETGRWSQAGHRQSLAQIEPRWKAFVDSEDQLLFGKTVRTGWDRWRSGDFAGARAKASDALAIDDKCRSARRLFAQSASAEGDFDTAAAAYESLLKQVPADFDALLGAADALLAAAKKTQDQRAAEAALAAGRRVFERVPPQLRYLGLLRAIDAAEVMRDTPRTLELVRECQRQKGVPREVQNTLLEKETVLVRRSIGKESKSGG